MSSYTDEGSITEDDPRYKEGFAIKGPNKFLEDIGSAENQKLIAQAANAGHEIANHSYPCSFPRQCDRNSPGRQRSNHKTGNPIPVNRDHSLTPVSSPQPVSLGRRQHLEFRSRVLDHLQT